MITFQTRKAALPQYFFYHRRLCLGVRVTEWFQVRAKGRPVWIWLRSYVKQIVGILIPNITWILCIPSTLPKTLHKIGLIPSTFHLDYIVSFNLCAFTITVGKVHNSTCALSFSYPDSVPHMTTPEQMEKNILALLRYLVCSLFIRLKEPRFHQISKAIKENLMYIHIWHHDGINVGKLFALLFYS